MTREEWLNIAAEHLGKVFDAAGVRIGGRYRISCGFPSRKALSLKSRRIGECHPMGASGDRINEVFIHPCLSDGFQVLEILAHELIHVSDDCESGHKGTFRKAMKAIGLEGKPTSTHAGDALSAHLNDILGKIEKYPHAELNSYVKTKKQGTRLLKATCPECGYVIRVTKQWADLGLPECGLCHVAFKLEVTDTDTDPEDLGE